VHHDPWILFVCEYFMVQSFNVFPAVIREDTVLDKGILYKFDSECDIVIVSAIVFFPPLDVQ